MYLSRLSAWRPDEVLDNDDLAKLVDTSDAWIFEHVGIRERRKSPREMPIHEQGARAARQAIEGLAEPLDLVLCGASLSDWHAPSTANLIASELGLPEMPAFDVRAACSSFIFGLHTLRGMIASGMHQRALLVVPEVMTHVTNYADRNTCVLFGDASFACVVSRERPQGLAFEVLDTRVGSRSADWKAITVPLGGTFDQQGSAVQGFAIRKMAALVSEQLQRERIDWFIGHQANAGILTRICDRVGLRHEQSLSNIEKFGNTAAAGAPTVLVDHLDRFRDGERIVVATAGAGLSWGSTLLSVHRGQA